MPGIKGPRSPAALEAAKQRAQRELQLRILFARRLEAARVKAGWNMSELARRATTYLPKAGKGQKQGKAIGRDLISHYTRGRIRPRPEYLDAIAKALGTTADELMPSSLASAAPAPLVSPMKIEQMEDGQVMLQISRVVPLDIGMKIVSILQHLDSGDDNNQRV